MCSSYKPFPNAPLSELYSKSPLRTKVLHRCFQGDLERTRETVAQDTRFSHATRFRTFTLPFIMYLQHRCQGYADYVGHSTDSILHNLLPEENMQAFPCQQGVLCPWLLYPSVNTLVIDLYQLEQWEPSHAKASAPWTNTLLYLPHAWEAASLGSLDPGQSLEISLFRCQHRFQWLLCISTSDGKYSKVQVHIKPNFSLKSMALWPQSKQLWTGHPKIRNWHRQVHEYLFPLHIMTGHMPTWCDLTGVREAYLTVRLPWHLVTTHEPLIFSTALSSLHRYFSKMGFIGKPQDSELD